MFENVLTVLETYLPQALTALVVLVVGWILAIVISRFTRSALERLRIGKRLQVLIVDGDEPHVPAVEHWISQAVFALLLLLVIGAFFQILGLTVVTDPILVFMNEIFAYAPRLIGPVVLLIVAWVVAVLARVFVKRAVETLKLEGSGDGAGEAQDTDPRRLSKTLGDLAYWLTLLLFLPAILSSLNLDGLLQPVQNMVNEALGYLPNLLAAGAIILVGWFVARILRRIVSSLLSAAGTDSLVSRVAGQQSIGGQKPSDLIGLIIYVLVFVPVLIASLNALELQAVTAPASAMLETFLTALPALFSAAVLVVLAYFVGRIVSGLVASLLAGVGFNNVLSRLGIRIDDGREGRSPAEIAGYVTFLAILIFASIEALRLIDFDAIADLGVVFLLFAARIGVGLAILALGLWIANMVSAGIRATDVAQAGFLASIARIAIMALALAMGLGEMGLANEIIELAFGLTLGAIAVAVAIAFGLGGRDQAAHQIAEWQEARKKGGTPAKRD